MALSPLLIGLLAAVCLGGLAFAAMPYLSGEVRAERRQDQFVNRAPREIAVAQRSAASRREQVAQSLKDLDQRQAAKNKVDLQTRIAQAGLNLDEAALLPLERALGARFRAHGLPGDRQSLRACSAACWWELSACRAGSLSYLTKRRVKKFMNEFPNAMDVVVRGVRSGLPLGDCFRIIASEAGRAGSIGIPPHHRSRNPWA